MGGQGGRKRHGQAVSRQRTRHRRPGGPQPAKRRQGKGQHPPLGSAQGFRGGQRRRQHRPRQPEGRRQNHRRQRQQPLPRRPAVQPQKSRRQHQGPARRQQQGGQRQPRQRQGPRAQHRRELDQRSQHHLAQPAKREQVHHRQRGPARPVARPRRPGHRPAQRHGQKRQGRGEPGHGPTGKLLADHRKRPRDTDRHHAAGSCLPSLRSIKQAGCRNGRRRRPA